MAFLSNIGRPPTAEACQLRYHPEWQPDPAHHYLLAATLGLRVTEHSDSRRDRLDDGRVPDWVVTMDTLRPPFEVHHEIYVHDQDGPLCKAETPEIAAKILHALQTLYRRSLGSKSETGPIREKASGYGVPHARLPPGDHPGD